MIRDPEDHAPRTRRDHLGPRSVCITGVQQVIPQSLISSQQGWDALRNEVIGLAAPEAKWLAIAS